MLLNLFDSINRIHSSIHSIKGKSSFLTMFLRLFELNHSFELLISDNFEFHLEIKFKKQN